MGEKGQMQAERGGATLVYVCRVVDQGTDGADSGQLKLVPRTCPNRIMLPPH